MARRRQLLLVALVTAALFVLVEGFASLGLTAWKLATSWRTGPVEHRYSRYDAELGWLAVAGSYRDFYGPGKHLDINAQGARSTSPHSRAVPAGRVRLLCTGDSFTLGWGVSNESTWAAQLERIEPRWQTVNFGQGGYAIDQSYLLFRRVSNTLDYNIHVFALITDDFNRATRADFLGYPKPVLCVRAGGRLEVGNIPIPRTARWRQWWASNRHLLSELRAVEIAGWHLPAANPVAALAWHQDPALRAMVPSLFASLKAESSRRNATVVLAWLPSLWDHAPAPGENEFRALVHQEAARLGIAVFDPIAAFRAMPRAAVDRLFIQPGETAREGGVYHYNEAGNRTVAEWLAAWLRQRPE